MRAARRSVGCAPVECVDGWIGVGSLFGGILVYRAGTFMRVAWQDGAAGCPYARVSKPAAVASYGELAPGSGVSAETRTAGREHSSAASAALV